ncbi:MAG: cation:proton antiporter subunit C [Chloroflexi bacterium]|nr:cation:proton antiporter subunit C [Chloroflexota bacterium]
MLETFLGRYVYAFVVALLAIGLYGMLTKRNLVKKLIGMTIFQTAIFLFFIEGSTKMGATVPVIVAELGSDPARYVNPLPHALILTAIVVSVATIGVALALVLKIYRTYQSIDEDDILKEMGK